MLNVNTKQRTVLNTMHLILVPVRTSLLPIFILVLVGLAGYHDSLAQAILSGLVFFLWGCMGLPMIIRKEVPWFVINHGWLAVVQGTILLIIFWGVALGFLVRVLSQT